MKETIHNKLIRDHIPEIIEENGEVAVTRTLNDIEYRRALLEKLVEEAQELLDSDGDLGERADVQEVLDALDTLNGTSEQELEVIQRQKALARGAFENRIFLEKTQTT